MSFASSTEPRHARHSAGLQPWQFYLLLSLVAATVAVAITHQTQPAALILLSASIISAGIVAAAVHGALTGFFGLRDEASRRPPVSGRVRAQLEREKMLALRAIKELEFDRAMGKVSDADFAEINANLRARALALIQEIDRAGADAPGPDGQAENAAREPAPADVACASCGTKNDSDARFCKQCGASLARTTDAATH